MNDGTGRVRARYKIATLQAAPKGARQVVAQRVAQLAQRDNRPACGYLEVVHVLLRVARILLSINAPLECLTKQGRICREDVGDILQDIRVVQAHCSHVDANGAQGTASSKWL